MAGRVKEQRNRIGGWWEGEAAAKLSKGKAGGRKDERNRQGAGKSHSLFSLTKARGPAVSHLAQGRDGGRLESGSLL